MAESLVLPGSSHLLSHLWPLGSLNLELCLLGCQHPRLASPVCPEPLQAHHVLDLGFLTGSLRALLFPSPSPACGVSGLWPDPARRASAWTRTCGWGSSLPGNKGPWPRLTHYSPQSQWRGWLATSLPSCCSADPCWPSTNTLRPPLPAQASFHRVLVLECFWGQGTHYYMQQPAPGRDVSFSQKSSLKLAEV